MFAALLFCVLIGPAFGTTLLPAVPAELQPWLGTFHGSCVNDDPKIHIPVFQAERFVQPINGTSSYVWRTTFYMDNASPYVKEYKLVTLDLARGLFVVDEGPVRLDSYLRNSAFYSLFEANGGQLAATETLDGDKLSFEYLTFSTQPNVNTSNERATNYPFQSRMHCDLTRVNKMEM